MSNAILRGDAVAVAQVTRIIPGTVVAGHIYSLQINGKKVSVTAATSLPADLVDDLVDAISESTIPEFQELIAESDGETFTLTSNEPGVPFELTTLSGDFATDEYQVITVSNATGGTFTLTYQYLDTLGILQEESTAGLAYNVSTADLQTALEGLTHIGSGNVLVTGSIGNYIAHFTGTLARQDVYSLISDGASLTGGDAVLTASVIQPAIAGTDELQTVTLIGSPSGGTFTLSFRGATTSALAYNASTGDVQTALRALITIGSTGCTVGGSAGAWAVTFAGPLGHQAVEDLTIDCDNLTGGTVFATMATTTEGAPAINQKYYLHHYSFADTQARIRLTRSTYSSWSGGTWDLYVNVLDIIVPGIPWDATDAEIAALVEGVLDQKGVIVQSTGGTVIIALVGPLFDMTISGVSVNSSITGGSISVHSFVSGVDVDNPSPADCTYKFQIGAVVSATITREATAAQIQAALTGMSNVGTGNAVVTLLEGTSLHDTEGLFQIEFTNSLSGQGINVLLVFQSGDGTGQVWLDSYQRGSAGGGANEVQTLTLSGSLSTGTFTLGFDGYETDPIPYNATANDVEAAVVALFGIDPGDIECTGGDLPGSAVTFTFGGKFSFTDVPQIIVNDSYLKATVDETTPGVTGQNEIQRLSIAGQDVWGGTLTLTFDGDTTSALPYTLTALQADNELETLSSLGAGTISATGGPFPESYIDIEFTGSAAETNVPLITGTTTSLKNGTVDVETYDPMIVDTETLATGPSHWNDATNWTTGRVPEWGDSVTISEGETELKYGLRQVSTFTVDTVNDEVIPTGCDLIEGQKVRCWNSGGALPAGLTANTDYYVLTIDTVTRRFGLATSADGAAIDITDAGTGTHYIGVRLSAVSPLPAFYVDARWTGELGLPQRATNDYWEYRPRYLVVGLDPAGSQTMILGQGDGSGSGLIRIDTGTDQANIEVISSAGSSETGTPPVNLLGVNNANVVTVYDGDVGIAFFAGEVSTLNRLNVRSGNVALGSVTFAGTAPMLDRTGGEVRTQDQVTMAGVLRLRG